MKVWTFQEFSDTLRRELDLQDSGNFISQDELASILNEAIDQSEIEINKISEDYFLSSAALTLVSGTAEINLPSTIYAQKIRALIYANGDKIYPIPRIRDPQKFYKKAEIDQYGGSETEYSYLIKSVASAQDQIVLSPTPQESGAYITAWFIRNANRIPMIGENSATSASQLATVIDVPEAINFIKQFARVRVFEKEKDPRYPAAVQTLEAFRKTMVEVLTQRVPDNDDTVPVDISHYLEMN